MADKQRGERIRDRREELHLTQPAVVELLEDAARALPESHDLHPATAGKAPVTLRGYQSYEQGGGIIWEKAKLLAGVLQMDVQALMNGEPDRGATPDPFPPASTEGALAEVLAAITAQLIAQTEVLNEVRDVLLEVKDLLGKDTETAGRIEAATKRVDEASRTLLASAVSKAGAGLRGGTQGQGVKAPKRAPKRTPGASPKDHPSSQR